MGKVQVMMKKKEKEKENNRSITIPNDWNYEDFKLWQPEQKTAIKGPKLWVRRETENGQTDGLIECILLLIELLCCRETTSVIIHANMTASAGDIAAMLITSINLKPSLKDNDNEGAVTAYINIHYIIQSIFHMHNPKLGDENLNACAKMKEQSLSPHFLHLLIWNLGIPNNDSNCLWSEFSHCTDHCKNTRWNNVRRESWTLGLAMRVDIGVGVRELLQHQSRMRRRHEKQIGRARRWGRRRRKRKRNKKRVVIWPLVQALFKGRPSMQVKKVREQVEKRIRLFSTGNNLIIIHQIPEG